jgi:hypothetical protein
VVALAVPVASDAITQSGNFKKADKNVAIRSASAIPKRDVSASMVTLLLGVGTGGKGMNLTAH